MFCIQILFSFFFGFCAIHASDETGQMLQGALNLEKQILQKTLEWKKMFVPHVSNDPGVKHFTSPIADHPSILLERFCDFEEIDICSVLSNLRCATCFAMTINPHVGEDIFTKALAECHVSEIYQVFVAADSYYKGHGNSSKFQTLKRHLPEDLRDKGALLATKPLPANTARKYQSSVFERDLTWLNKWEDSRKALSMFLQFGFLLPDNISSHFMKLCGEDPYVLHHLEISDFQQYAHTLVPILLKEDDCFTLAEKMHSSFAGDSQKEEILITLGHLTHLLPVFDPPKPHAEKAHCTDCVTVIWTLFKALNAHVTQKQWSHCITCLRQSLPWIDEAFQNNHPWLTTVFKCQELPQKALSSRTAFDYYTKHHAPYIFKIHERIIDTLYEQLAQYIPPAKKKDFKDRLLWVKRNNTEGQYDLQDLYIGLKKFHTLRCRILWDLAKKETLSSDFVYLHSMCSQAEKKALCVNAHWLMFYITPGRKILTNVRLLDPLKDLSRISIAKFTVECCNQR